jgi:hypothetical protein
MKTDTTFLSTGLGKIITGIAVVLGLRAGYGLLPDSKPISNQAAASYVGESSNKQFTPNLIVTGEVCEFEFPVMGTYSPKAGLLLINSLQNYKDPNNQTLVIDTQKFSKELGSFSQNGGKALRGHLVKGTGHKATYKGNPQVIVEKLEVK